MVQRHATCGQKTKGIRTGLVFSLKALLMITSAFICVISGAFPVSDGLCLAWQTNNEHRYLHHIDETIPGAPHFCLYLYVGLMAGKGEEPCKAHPVFPYLALEKPPSGVTAMLEHHILQVLAWICENGPIRLLNGKEKRIRKLTVLTFARTAKRACHCLCTPRCLRAYRAKKQLSPSLHSCILLL